MSTFKERLIAEKQELDEKIEKLSAFVKSSPTFQAIEGQQRFLLTTQLGVMQTYSMILGQRLGLL